MVYSNDTLAANEIAAFTAGAPAFLAENLLENAIIGPIWTTDGSLASDSQTDPLYPIDALSDFSMTAPSRSIDNGTVQAISVQIAPGEFDTVIIHFQDTVSATYDVTVQVSNNNTFSLNTITVGTFNNVTRVARLVLDNITVSAVPNQLIRNVEFIRVTFTRVSGIPDPVRVREWAIGRRLQLSQPFLLPYDPQALGSSTRSFVSAARAEHVTTYAEGYADRQLLYNFTGDDLNGLDDLATLRTLQARTRSGARPVFARLASSEGWLLGDLANLNFPIADFEVREWSTNFTEHAPFGSRET